MNPVLSESPAIITLALAMHLSLSLFHASIPFTMHILLFVSDFNSSVIFFHSLSPQIKPLIKSHPPPPKKKMYSFNFVWILTQFIHYKEVANGF